MEDSISQINGIFSCSSFPAMAEMMVRILWIKWGFICACSANIWLWISFTLLNISFSMDSFRFFTSSSKALLSRRSSSASAWATRGISCKFSST